MPIFRVIKNRKPADRESFASAPAEGSVHIASIPLILRCLAQLFYAIIGNLCGRQKSLNLVPTSLLCAALHGFDAATVILELLSHSVYSSMDSTTGIDMADRAEVLSGATSTGGSFCELHFCPVAFLERRVKGAPQFRSVVSLLVGVRLRHQSGETGLSASWSLMFENGRFSDLRPRLIYSCSPMRLLQQLSPSRDTAVHNEVSDLWCDGDVPNVEYL
jgi:hypothetical protein